MYVIDIPSGLDTVLFQSLDARKTSSEEAIFFCLANINKKSELSFWQFDSLLQ